MVYSFHPSINRFSYAWNSDICLPVARTGRRGPAFNNQVCFIAGLLKEKKLP